MDLPWFCWQRSKVSIRQECWILCLIAAAFLACARFTSDFVLCCAFWTTQLPNIKIGNVGLLFSALFSLPRRKCYTDHANERQGRGVSLPELFPQKTMEGKHGRASMQSSSTIPHSSAGCPQLHPHLHHHAGTFSNTNPTVSSAWLGKIGRA